MAQRPRTPGYERAFWTAHARSYDDFGGLDSPEVAIVTGLIGDIAEGRSFDTLDLGAGTGNYAVSLARAGHRVTAIDLSGGMLTQLAADERVENGDGTSV